jgi:hypothetical protein
MKRAQSNQTLLTLINIVLGVIIITPFIYHAAYGITYGNAAIVAQDLGMTTNILQSVPTPTQVQYQPDTTDYVISLSQQHVTVQSPSGTFKHRLYNPPGSTIKPATLTGEPTVSLTNTNNEIAFDNNEATSLSTFCEAINVRRNTLKTMIQSANLTSIATQTRSALQDAETVSTGSNQSDLTIALQSTPMNTFLVRHNENATNRLATEVACNIVANTKAETTSFISYNLQYDDSLPQDTVIVEVGNESNTQAGLLAQSIAAGITASTDG